MLITHFNFDLPISDLKQKQCKKSKHNGRVDKPNTVMA